jgi:hypothetical protein
MEGLLKLRVTLDRDSWHELESEGIWTRVIRTLAEKVLVEIDNIPFFAKGLSIGDKVIARRSDGELLLENVVERSGNSSYRIFVENEDANISTELAKLKGKLCEWEMAKFRGGILRALNVPSSADIFEIYRLLKEGQANGIWYFEEGHVGHRLPGDPTSQTS